jgi:hypothetical protein
MAINEAVNINVDVKGTQQINEAGKAAENLDRTSKKMKQGLNDAAKSTTLMGNATGKLREKLNRTNKNFKDLQGQLAAIPGPVGFVIQGFTGISTAMKTMLANPVGIFLSAIVGVLYTLKRALTDSERGQDRLNRVLTVAGALWGNILDIIADVGEAIIKAVTDPIASMKSFANGVKEFILHPIDSVRKAYKASTSAVKEFVKEQKEEIKAADEVAQMRNKANKIERALLIERSKLEQRIAELRLKSRQEDEFGAEERRKALLDAQTLEEQLLNKEVEALELRRDAQILENTFSRTNRENADKEAQAIAAVNQVVSRRLNLQRATQRELNRVNDEIARNVEQARAKEIAAEKKAEAEKKKLAKEAEERLKKEAEDEEEAFQAWLEWETERVETQQANADYVAERDKQRAEAKMKLEQQVFDQSQALANAVIALAGEQSAIGKAVALASIGADTARALSSALANTQSPTPDNVATGGLAGIGKYLVLATNILTNAKRAYDIIKAPAPSVSGSSGSATAPTGFQAPNVRLPRTEQFTGQQRIYVTEYDISNTQEKVKVTEDVSIVK